MRTKIESFCCLTPQTNHVINEELKFIFLITVLLLSFQPSFVKQAHSQSLEIGAGFGLTTYDGELTPPSLIGRFYILEPGVTVFARYNFSKYFSARLGFVATAIRGDDQRSGVAWRETRNLSFHTPIYDLSAIGEWNIFGFYPNREGRWFTPYLFGGVAIFSFNPTTNFNGAVVELQPLGTEGQGLPQYPDRDFYSLRQFAVPFGGGLKWAVTDRLTLSGEIGWRRTFTDYLDDVSTTYVPYDILLESRGPLAANISRRAWQVLGISPQEDPSSQGANVRRGSPTTPDWYIVGFVKVSYQLYMDDLTPSNVKCKF